MTPVTDTRQIPALLARMTAAGASDLHLSTRNSPCMRIDGRLHALDVPPIDHLALWDWLDELLVDEQVEMYEVRGDVDFGVQGEDGQRFRVSLFRESGSDTLAIRRLQDQIPTMTEIGLPPAPQAWTSLEHGLILVTGPTGCGKSTTIASMVDRINHTRGVHIVTIEDPIEYLLPRADATGHQRAVGPDTSAKMSMYS